MSIIDTLITDRTGGAYNATDMNRVGEALVYVSDLLLSSCGTSAPVSPKTNWATTDIPSIADITAYLADVQTIRDALTVGPDTPAAPPDMDGLTAAEANAIERILHDVDTIINIMAQTFVPCGSGLCGEENL